MNKFSLLVWFLALIQLANGTKPFTVTIQNNSALAIRVVMGREERSGHIMDNVGSETVQSHTSKDVQVQTSIPINAVYIEDSKGYMVRSSNLNSAQRNKDQMLIYSASREVSFQPVAPKLTEFSFKYNAMTKEQGSWTVLAQPSMTIAEFKEIVAKNNNVMKSDIKIWNHNNQELMDTDKLDPIGHMTILMPANKPYIWWPKRTAIS